MHDAATPFRPNPLSSLCSGAYALCFAQLLSRYSKLFALFPSSSGCPFELVFVLVLGLPPYPPPWAQDLELDQFNDGRQFVFFIFDLHTVQKLSKKPLFKVLGRHFCLNRSLYDVPNEITNFGRSRGFSKQL